MFPLLRPLSLQTSYAALLSNNMLADILAGERLQPVIPTDMKSCCCVKDGVQALIDCLNNHIIHTKQSLQAILLGGGKC